MVVTMTRIFSLLMLSFATLAFTACVPSDMEKLQIERIGGEKTLKFKVKLATNAKEWKQGLMGVTEMPDDEGMLFLFDDYTRRGFWMKDTLIPLDIIFISEDGTINQIYYEAQPLDEYSIVSVYPAKAVLEINAGLSEKYGLTLKDKVKFRAFEQKELAE